ncbi:MAG: MBL fold metallo-hydrolase [Spirochaetaceae bacterium]|nr:MBL fold metallo-hydrolase [Spirochaetaceae bacterium]
MSLFHAVLGSGSSGNSFVFYDGFSSILIDQGFSLVELKRRLGLVNVPISSVKAVFLTHFHPDHHKGLGVISKKLGVPLYINKNSIIGEDRIFEKLNLPKECVNPISPGDLVKVDNFEITSFVTSHDSKGSVGYYISNNETKITFITDTGLVSEDMLAFAKNSDYLFLEANYDELLLEKGPYPLKLKNRIRGNWGHLSNNQAFCFIKDSEFKGLGVYFIHLSSINNKVSIVDKMATENLDGIDFITCPRGELVRTSEVKIE